MIKLEEKNYYRVIPLLDKIDYNHLFARMVALNKVDGSIYVDNKDNPSICFVTHMYGMGFLCGINSNALFNKHLISYLKSNSIDKPKWFLVYPNSWEQTLDDLLGNDLFDVNENIANKDKLFLKATRVNFKFIKEKMLHELRLPKGFKIKKIDATLYSDIVGSVIPKYFWNKKMDFLEKGVGFSLVNDNEIVSTCFSSYMSDDIIELGIETSENYRNKGYSIYAATKLIDYCIDNGYDVMWSCRKENIPSFKVAEKLGFVADTYHPYYHVPSGKFLNN